MPITFDVDSNSFEGANLAGETLAGFDFSVFGGIITNNGTIEGPVTANTDVGIELTNTIGSVITKVSGSPYAVELLGNGGRNLFNDGTIIGNIRFGNGWDSMQNSGLIQGQINMGKGNDRLVNQVIPGIDGGETVGTITGKVTMGQGDDTVLNLGILNDVNLGGGNDSYSVTDLFSGDLSAPSGTAGNVKGAAGNDEISGGTEIDKFYGGSGDDTLIGNGGNDQLFGNADNDIIYGGDGNDKIEGGKGNDTIYGGNNNDRIKGGADNDVIFAGNGNDKVSGGNGNDYIQGSQGNDQLIGNNGDDTIDGGIGHDLLTGNSGADVFVFSGNSGRDEIVDFSANDQIELVMPLGASVTYSDVINNSVFVNGNAIINLSDAFNASGTSDVIDRGSVLTINNVSLADLDASAFIFETDILAVT
jgi:Ca2+-binding RTX toxin-like protein